MNIKELIEYLEKLDPDYEVYIKYEHPQFENPIRGNIREMDLNIMVGYVTLSDIENG